MMGRSEKVLFFTVVALLACVLLLLALQSNYADYQVKTHSVSVLTRSVGDRFRKGLEQAAIDYNVDLHIVSSYEANAAAQKLMLQREINNNVDAVVMVPENPYQLQEYVESMQTRVPVVTLEQPFPGLKGSAPHVSPDNRQIGSLVAELAQAHALNLPVLVLMPTNARENINERLEGLESRFEQAGVVFSLTYCAANEEGVMDALSNRGKNVIITLDEQMLVPLCQRAREGDVLFGAGFASGARQHLESGRIEALVVFSEYDMGYFSLQRAVEAAKGQAVEDMALELYVATADNMYDNPLNKILFPIG
ncbi:substrate-binding domain-containing protein [Eubacteriales bacterium OttesenSCG-928-K08]|nr:substrate-binding domain-containing protein [Eubacteriales bacterium OttesenSCG-928-K08]